MTGAPANVALVHDYLNQRGGAERVFAHIANAFPGAPVYTSLFDPASTGDLVAGHEVRTSWLARIPFANRHFRALAPLYPHAFESFDLSAYDTIISSTTAWAKGVIVPPGAVHISYINTVSRFVFAYDQYVGGFGLRQFARPLLATLAAWDRKAAQRPTAFIANSKNVADRVERFYGRQSYVLHCPVDMDRFAPSQSIGEHFIVVSRLLPYKRIDLAIEACNLAGVPLLIAGTGPAYAQLSERARGTTATVLGYVDDARLAHLLATARAAILPGEEDFGLVPLEAAASGRPTLAYRGGGAIETIREGITGAFFDEPTAQSLAGALSRFDPDSYCVDALLAHAQTFSPPRFIAALHGIVAQVRATA